MRRRRASDRRCRQQPVYTRRLFARATGHQHDVTRCPWQQRSTCAAAWLGFQRCCSPLEERRTVTQRRYLGARRRRIKTRGRRGRVAGGLVRGAGAVTALWYGSLGRYCATTNNRQQHDDRCRAAPCLPHDPRAAVNRAWAEQSIARGEIDPRSGRADLHSRWGNGQIPSRHISLSVSQPRWSPSQKSYSVELSITHIYKSHVFYWKER